MLHLAHIPSIDWINAVIIPIILSVVIGIPLALFAGFIGARYLEFVRIRGSALNEFVNLGIRLTNACFENYHGALSGALHTFLQIPSLEMRAAHQTEAALEIVRIASVVRAEYRAEIEKRNPLVLPGLTNEETRWQTVVDAGKATLDTNSQYVAQLCRIKPSLLVFFKGAGQDVVSLLTGQLVDELEASMRKREKAPKRNIL